MTIPALLAPFSGLDAAAIAAFLLAALWIGWRIEQDSASPAKHAAEIAMAAIRRPTNGQSSAVMRRQFRIQARRSIEP